MFKTFINKFIISVTFLLVAIQYSSAQNLHVFGDKRLDVERQFAMDISASGSADTMAILERIADCIDAVDHATVASDFECVVGSLSRLAEMAARYCNPNVLTRKDQNITLDPLNGFANGLINRCLQRMEFIAGRYNVPGAYLQAKINLVGNLLSGDSPNIRLAVEAFHDAETFLSSYSDARSKCVLNLQQGITFGVMGDYNTSLRGILKAIFIVENQLDDPDLLSEAYYRASLIYMVLDEYENASVKARQAISICQKFNYIDREYKCHLILGDYYRKRGKNPNYIMAWGEYETLLDMLTTHNIHSDYFVAKAYNGKGLSLMHQGDYGGAAQLLYKSLAMRNVLGYKSDLSESYISLAELYAKLYRETKEPSLNDSIHDYYRKCYELSWECRNYKDLHTSTDKLSEIMLRRGDYKQAYKYKSLALSSFEKLSKQRNNPDLAKAEMLLIMEKERAAYEEDIRKKEQLTIISNVAICIAVVALGFLIGVCILLRNKKRKNQQLREQKEELRQQKEEMRQQSEVLAMQNAELEKLSLVARKTDNAIFLTDSNGDIVWVNEAFTRHSGYDISDYLDEVRASQLKVSSNTHIDIYMDMVRQTKQPVTYTSNTYRKDGSEMWIQTTLSPSLNLKGDIEMFIAVCSDITDLHLAQDKIAEQNKEINESLEYARKIQDAIQPPKLFVDYVLGDYFVVNLPKDIVSGDFHWIAHKNGKTLFSLADCTGHGIPGGFMSMIEQVMFNNVLKDTDNITSASILNEMRSRNIKLLHQRGRAVDSQDGMDASLFVFDRDRMVLNYAAGYSYASLLRFGTPDEDTLKRVDEYSCQILQNDDQTAYLIKLKAHRFPVGAHPKDDIPFTDMFFNVSDGDIVYTSSDGFMDQFGGPNQKKFSTASFERLILQVCHLPLAEQQQIFTDTFMEWRGDHYQTDDVHVFATMLKKEF